MDLSALPLQALQAVLVLALAPLLTGVIRKTKARLLTRRGPSVFQPYRDLLRLLRKERAIAPNASLVFTAAPYAIFAFTWVAAALVPTFGPVLPASPIADLIVIIALLASARFLIALAALDIGTSFGGIGASREVMIAAIAEPAILALILSLALVAGTTRLSDIVLFVHSSAAGLRISLFLALFGIIMVAIAENGRIPIDNPATHLELTMVHEAMVLEYSGPDLALIEAANAVKLLLYVSLIVTLFLPSLSLGLLMAGAFYVAKLLLGGIVLASFEVTIAKMRVFRVPQFVGGAVMLGLLAVVLRLVSKSF